MSLSLGAIIALGYIAVDSRVTTPHRGQTRRVARASAQWQPPAGDLTGLCRQSDTIVVAQVTGVFRESHNPVNCPTSVLMSTVYTVSVEQYIQFDGAPQLPPTLKVFVNGGTDENGTVRVLDGEPGLNVGDRYILFLESAKDGDSIGMEDGIWGIERYADEYLVAERIRGKLRLAGGVTTVPADPYQSPEPWEWELSGGTLLGLTQDDAITQIQEGIAAAAIAEAEASQFAPEPE